MSDEETESNGGENETIAEVGRMSGVSGEIVVSIGRWTPDEGEPVTSIRITREVPSKGRRAVDGKRIRAIGGLKSPEEAKGLAELLVKAGPALAKALKT